MLKDIASRVEAARRRLAAETTETHATQTFERERAEAIGAAAEQRLSEAPANIKPPVLDTVEHNRSTREAAAARRSKRKRERIARRAAIQAKRRDARKRYERDHIIPFSSAPCHIPPNHHPPDPPDPIMALVPELEVPVSLDEAFAPELRVPFTPRTHQECVLATPSRASAPQLSQAGSATPTPFTGFHQVSSGAEIADLVLECFTSMPTASLLSIDEHTEAALSTAQLIKDMYGNPFADLLE